MLVLAAPTGLELLARGRGFRLAALVGPIIAELLGVLVIGAGLLVLTFNGSIQDYGEQPAQSLGTAIPLLAIGGMVAAIPWTMVLLRPRR